MFDSITSRAHGVTGAMIVWGMVACVAVTLAVAMFITAFPAH